MQIQFHGMKKGSANCAIFLVSNNNILPEEPFGLNKSHMEKILTASSSYGSKSGNMIHILAHPDLPYLNVILLCLGETSDATDITVQNAGGILVTQLNKLKITEVDLFIDTAEKYSVDLSTNLLIGMQLKNYTFNKYFVNKKPDNLLYLESINVFSSSHSEDQKKFEIENSVIQSTLYTRDLVSEPGNYLYPESFANECEKLTRFGLKVKVLDLEALTKLGMGALLGVAQGSAQHPRVVILEWSGDPESKEGPIALVGKGVTFDTGGIDLKPSNGISEMKQDMAGAATVAGVLRAVAMRKAKVNVIGALGIVENMPSGTAQRPSDIVYSMSGQTIEVDNTDAEGRLVLADVMHYVQITHSPCLMIDLATLTGAIRIALGDIYAGLFSNSDMLSEQLIEAGAKVDENLWRLPLHDAYDKQINSTIADIKNVGQSGRGGGSITAAQFLKRFVINDLKWAHLDIAAVAATKYGTDVCSKGATGFGVRLLDRFIRDNFEA